MEGGVAAGEGVKIYSGSLRLPAEACHTNSIAVLQAMQLIYEPSS